MTREGGGALPRWLRALIALGFWVAVWWFASLLVGREVLLPAPDAVLRRLLALAGEEGFWAAVSASLLRITAGFLAAALLGSLFGAASALFRPFDMLASPLLSVVRATPVASFIILALVWLDRQIIPAFIAFLIAFPVIYANVKTGVRAVSPALLEMVKVFRVKRWLIAAKIYFPAVLPHFLSAAQTALGLAWKAGVAAEVLCTPANSIGKMLYQSKVYLETVDLFAWTLTVILISVTAEKVLLALLRRRQRRETEGEAL